VATILISACPHDPSTRYGYYYMKKLGSVLAKYGHKVVLLKNAYLSKFQKVLQDYDPDFVIMNGHGGSKGVTGCGYRVLLGVRSWDRELGVKIVAENPEWMRGRIVYLFTCYAGKILAHYLINHGALAVAAYREAYIFLTEDGGRQNHTAYPFFYSALQLPILLAGGLTFGEGCQAVRDSFNDYLEQAEARDNILEAKYLYHDLVNFISLGNLKAKL
jgi:hypothetical protein